MSFLILGLGMSHLDRKEGCLITSLARCTMTAAGIEANLNLSIVWRQAKNDEGWIRLNSSPSSQAQLLLWECMINFI